MLEDGNKKSLFITGASGYLGQRFLELLELAQIDEIVCLRHQGTVAESAQITVVEGDLNEPQTFAHAIKEGVSVLHLAALTGKGSRADHNLFNLEATKGLLRAAIDQGAGEILFVSSVAVEFEDRAGYHYADAKAEAEKVVLASELPSLIVRPTMIFGPHAPVLEGLSKLASAPLVPVFGGGGNCCQPVFVDDLARWLDFALHRIPFDGSTFTIGGPTILTMKELLAELRQLAKGKKGGLIPFPLGLTRSLLRLAEPLLLPLLPLTAGQLASFANSSLGQTLSDANGGHLLRTPLAKML